MLSLYNTLTKQKDTFEPLYAGKVGMYVCGPTVYDYAHIGNLRAYIVSDTLRRTLENSGYEVRMIKNITDVGHLTADDIAQGDQGEDKVQKKALAEKKTPLEIAEFYTDYFLRAEEKLGILPAHYYPRATAHIPAIIKLIEGLIKAGHAYEANGNVFYDVTSFPNYGQLSGNTLENLKVGARLEEHPDKRHPWDFALWLKAPEGHLMHWAAPFTKHEGYPGWHIECSAMAIEYLGDTLDIHTGGEDHIFPHHEAEIAQSEGMTGKPFARFFLHHRHMLVDGEKMSKSKQNFYTLEDLEEKGYAPQDLRLLFLGAHYRSQMNFTWDALSQAKKNRLAILQAQKRLSRDAGVTAAGLDGVEYLERIQAAFRDDLNSPLALSVLLELCRHLNAALDNSQPINKKSLENVFGVIFFLFGLAAETEETIPEAVFGLAEERQAARAAKDFARSDELRKQLEGLGFKIEDSSEGYVLEKK